MSPITKKIGILLLLLFSIIFSSYSQVRVRGYYRKDGTYVRPHVRSNPDGNPYNNWSYPGNVNPYTGKVATGNPEIYLRNYYGSKKQLKHPILNARPTEGSKAFVSANVLNVRAHPSLNGRIIGKLNYREQVSICKIVGEWSYIKYYYINAFSGIQIATGYVATKYLLKY